MALKVSILITGYVDSGSPKSFCFQDRKCQSTVPSPVTALLVAGEPTWILTVLYVLL